MAESIKYVDKFQKWNESDLIPENALRESVTIEAVHFAKKFGQYLGIKEVKANNNQHNLGKGKSKDKVLAEPLNTNQLRKFFGDVKRQQLRGYDLSSFILLKPKLAYAVGRTKENNTYNKIQDLAYVLSQAIDVVAKYATQENQKPFENFIDIFEAIVAYHKEETGQKTT